MVGSVQLVVLVAAAFVVVATATQPNIIFIMADDLGYNDVSYRDGTRDIFTPNLDKLANNGVKLENYYVGPTCGPTRSQFLSGKYTIHMGLHQSNLPSCTKEAVPLSAVTVGDVLKEEGYSTHAIGKWHAGFHHVDYLPTSRGFDTFRGFLQASGDHYTHKSKYKNNKFSDEFLDFYNNTEPFPAIDGIYSTTAYTDRATELINNHDQQEPLFIYLAYQAPHNPLQYPSGVTLSKKIKSAARKKYAAMVEALDKGVGEVVDALNSTGMLDNTVIIFSSDNGGSGKKGASNYPLRGQKGSYYQGGVKALGFVYSPLLDPAQVGSEETGLIHVTDWLPTMLTIANGSSANLSIDGLNQWNTIRNGDSSPRTEVVLTIGKKKLGNPSTPFNEKTVAALIDGDFKLITGRMKSDVLYPNPPDSYSAWKTSLKDKTFSKTTKLFNLADDPYEKEDLSGKNATQTQKMLQRLRELQFTMEDAIDDTEYKTECDPRKFNNFWGPWSPTP